MNEKKFIELIKRYEEGSLSNKEKSIFDEWFNSLSKETYDNMWSKSDQINLWNNITEKLSLNKRLIQKRREEPYLIIETIQNLYNKFVKNQASKQEVNQLINLLQNNKNNKSVLQLLDKDWNKITQAVYSEHIIKESPTIILRSTSQANNKWPWSRKIAAAATIILLFSTGAWFFLTRDLKKTNMEGLPSRYKNDVAPGGNKATLTLAKGKSITLDDAKKGMLAKQGETHIFKKDDGQLVYNASDSKSKEILYNTLTTPRGGQYQLVLADGSKVWLNSASSITYPTQFNDKERVVKVSGEAYFEVASVSIKSILGKTRKVPFIVDVNNFKVQVLGTSFNIMAYKNEINQKTTLIEGSVKIIQDEKTKLLVPGQQAVLDKEQNNIQILDKVNIEGVIAWKNGYFHFDHAKMEDVMRSLSRWYNVEIIYEGDIPNIKFGGELQRNLKLSQILLILEKSKVLFKIEGNKLIVMNREN